MTNQNKEVEEIVGEMVRDFAQVGVPAKSEIKRRILSYGQSREQKGREAEQKKFITVPKGKTHQVHDTCEDCVQKGRDMAVDYIRSRQQDIALGVEIAQVVDQARQPSKE